MLSDDVKDAIQGAYRNWLQSRGLKPRSGQRAMIAHVANALARSGADENADSPICVVEAGTGTGKTIAYAVAAIPIARATGRSLVISTATVALQEQLVYRDLPDLQQAGALDFSFALAKGRGRYACPARLDAQLRQSRDDEESQLQLMAEFAPPVNRDLRGLLAKLNEAALDGSWAGDRDSWPDALSDAQWSLAVTDHHQCSGRRCSFVAQCPFFRARDGLDAVDCIVANHDLVLADLMLGGGTVLPPPEETIYVFDEAHHLPDKGCSHMSFQARIGLARENVEQCRRLAAELLAEPRSVEAIRKPLAEVPAICEELDQGLSAAGTALQQLLVAHANGSGEYRLQHGRVPDDVLPLADSLHGGLSRLVTALDRAVEELSSRLNEGGPRAQDRFALLGLALARAERLAGLWRSWAVIDPPQLPPLARWLRRSESQSVADLEVCSAPVLCAPQLHELIWSRAAGAVLTSATLTALGSFERLRMQAGLPEDCLYAVVPSPFAYAERATLRVPRLGADPRDPDAHTVAVTQWLEENLDPAEASLVLFASRRQMRDVYDAITITLREAVLMQDHFAKQELLRLHRERIDTGQGSVIFGLASFAEGIDLPGPYCMHVVIAKIPFAVPDDPLEAALAEWVEARGGNAFQELSVPAAALRLVQASGRLLRTESDTGRISVLDRRLVSRGYGRRILDSLPPFRRDIA